MTDACQILKHALELEPATALEHHAAHTTTCATCSSQARLVETLRAEPAPVDDVARARWLARMAPELDTIAAGRTGARRPWFAIAAAAMVAAGLGWWFGHTPAAAPPVAAIVERDVLRPYVVAGSAGEAAATALLSGRFAALEAHPGELVRATCDRDRAQRLALVGPARVAVTGASAGVLELATSGVVLVDMRPTAQVISIRAGAVVLRAQQATFAVFSDDRATVVFVDRGEVELGAMRLHAGDWFGPPAARSAAMVAALRDHANAIAPPPGRSGILALDGREPAITQSGAVLGTAPLWARIDAGEVTVVSANEQRVTVSVRDGELSRVAAHSAAPAPASAPVAAAPPLATPHVTATHPTTPPVVTPAVETASQLYLRAEAALRDSDHATAESIWRRLLETYPDAPQAEAALYDLATLVRARDLSAARGYLDRLLAKNPVALREPASYMSCHLYVDASELDQASRCFTAFRARFLDSAHDAEVLAWLAGRAEGTGGCAAAKDLDAEYLRRYPTGAFAARAASCRGAP